MRIVLAGFIIVLLVLSCGLAVRYNQDATAAQEELDAERYKRMVSEESLQKANQEVGNLSAELKRIQGKLESTQLVLERTKVINTELKDRLEKASEVQTTLDHKIADLKKAGSEISDVIK